MTSNMTRFTMRESAKKAADIIGKKWQFRLSKTVLTSGTRTQYWNLQMSETNQESLKPRSGKCTES